MKKVLVYDLPLRVFHWIFALLFVFSFSVGNFIDDDSWLYAYHMLSGITMSFMVILRIFWGIWGTKYSKFSSFKLKPSELVGYFKHILSGDTKRDLGHNPASSYAGVLMFINTFLLLLTGLLMVTGTSKDFFEDIHELLGFSFLILVISHIVGVVLHELRNKDGMIFSMINGKKDTVTGQDPISNQAPFVLVLLIILTLSFVSYLGKSYNTSTQSLNILGTSLNLGEKDNKHDVEYYNKYYNGEEDDDD